MESFKKPTAENCEKSGRKFFAYFSYCILAYQDYNKLRTYLFTAVKLLKNQRLFGGVSCDYRAANKSGGGEAFKYGGLLC